MQRREQLAELVVEHQGRLRVFIRMLGVDAVSVDDLAQDVFVVAYERLETLQQGEDAGKWLRGIARNLVRNELRKASRRHRILNARLTEILLHDCDDEMNEPTNNNWLAALTKCLSELPERARALIEGRYRDGLNATKLAVQCGMNAQGVRQALLRLRRELRECVERRTRGVT